jgi:hypothetical protein
MNQANPQPFLTFLVTIQSSKIRCDAWSADWLVASSLQNVALRSSLKESPSSFHTPIEVYLEARSLFWHVNIDASEDSTPVVNSLQGLMIGLASSRCRSSTTKFRLIVQLLGRVYSVVN